MPNLKFENVRISYSTHEQGERGRVEAVRGVNLDVPVGSTIGLAGASGCGKSTLAMSVLRLLPPNAKIEGRIMLGDESIAEMSWGVCVQFAGPKPQLCFKGRCTP
ncbi:ATP-binding cassette domain-containing protein [Leucobacter coleopterorum]|uniref:ATP-binding cassette domain-containing protein n=1 Tax=Leucobacter coleopterorum TaxID=2714933 RepID=UPI00244DE3CB|nr:ATP-binding cassette domain-containing protein [Leucobacter coleopterorum]